MLLEALSYLLLISSVAAGALMACAETKETVVSPVTTGTTSGDFSSNGLPFADGTSFERADRASVLGTTITLRAAKLDVTGSGLEPGWDFKTATSELVDATIVEVWDGDLNNDVFLTLDIDGDRVEFTTSDIINGTSVISDQGHEYWFDVPAFTNNLLVLIGSTDDLSAGDWEEIGFFMVVGLETNPDDLADRAIATYEGANLMVVATTDDCESCWGYGPGDINITANFSAATIEGNMDGVLIASFEGVIEGNGWNADIIDPIGAFSWEVTPQDVLEADGQLDGVFYGENGEETAGTIIVEFTAVSNDIEYDLTGAGFFVACEDTDSCSLLFPEFVE